MTPLPFALAFLPRLAMAWLWHYRRDSASAILVIGASCAAGLILWGITHGVVEARRTVLLHDAKLLEVTAFAQGDLTTRWLEQMAADPRVAFVVGRTRHLNPAVDVVEPGGKLLQGVELIPTNQGDPLVPHPQVRRHQVDAVWISAALAEKLSLTAGMSPRLLVRRHRQGHSEATSLTVLVQGALDARAFPHPAVFASVALICATETYRRGGALDPTDPRAEYACPFPSARLVAKDMDALLSLASSLREAGLEVRSQEQRVRYLLDLERDLTRALALGATLFTAGAAIALWVLTWLGITAKRQELGMMRLYGWPTSGLATLLALVMSATALGGLALAALLYQLGSSLLEARLASHGATPAWQCALPDEAAAVTVAITLALGWSAAVLGVWRIASFSPGEAIRRPMG